MRIEPVEWHAGFSISGNVRYYPASASLNEHVIEVWRQYVGNLNTTFSFLAVKNIKHKKIWVPWKIARLTREEATILGEQLVSLSGREQVVRRKYRKITV